MNENNNALKYALESTWSFIFRFSLMGIPAILSVIYMAAEGYYRGIWFLVGAVGFVLLLTFSIGFVGSFIGRKKAEVLATVVVVLFLIGGVVWLRFVWLEELHATPTGYGY